MRRILPILVFAAGFLLSAGLPEKTPFVLLIDAGHGGKDPGYVHHAEAPHEKDITLALAQTLKDIADQHPHFKVYTLRETDEFVDLKTRAKVAQVLKPDLLISLHLEAQKEGNALSCRVDGQSKQKKYSTSYARQILKGFQNKSHWQANPKPEEFNSFLLREAACPAVLLTAGNLAMPEAQEFWSQPENQKAFAQEILSALSQ